MSTNPAQKKKNETHVSQLLNKPETFWAEVINQ